VDGNGSAYVTGRTYSPDFPTQGAAQGSRGGACDVFVTKLTSSGQGLLYSTFLGGSNNDWSWDIAIDAYGCAYVTGETYSSNFPTANPYDVSIDGDIDAFVSKLSNLGNTLVYSTYLGGNSSQHDGGYGIIVDDNRNAYVTGWTLSTDFPVVNPIQTNNAGSYDAFLTLFDSSGHALTYSTYLGGSDADWGGAATIDAENTVFVTGYSMSSDFPTANPIQVARAGSSDAFITSVIYVCVDSDGDGYGDAEHPENDCPEDNCPAIFNPNQKDYNHDGEGDACDDDDDGDGFVDGSDNCPLYWNPGQENNDSDEFGDACDPDDDNDGVPDASDNCDYASNPGQEDNDHDNKGDVCDPDDDNDGIPDETDNCPLDRNPGQEDLDTDGIGDACDDDDDGDGLFDGEDNCPAMWNPGQDDGDADGVGNVCDNCPSESNPDQKDTNDDGEGDVCDDDDDGDGVPDGSDNCPLVWNPGQEDSDEDGIGDVCESCCIGLTGNIDCDENDLTDLSDLTSLIDYLFISHSSLCCAAEANTDGDQEGSVDLSDLTALIDFLFISFTPPAGCQ